MIKKLPLVSLLFFVMLLSSFVFINAHPHKVQSNKADWMRHTKYGVLVHYLEQLQNEQQPWNQGFKTSWDSCVNSFDVDLFAKQMNDIGAGYVIFTVYQGTKYMCIPNVTLEKSTGYARGLATSNRDLVNDLYNALSRYNIRLILYVTGDGILRDSKAMNVFKNPMLQYKQNGNQFIATQTWVNNWATVLKDISMRYGNKVSGWWVDGTYRFHGFNDTLLGVLHDALKAGNPNSIVAFNASPQKKVIYYSKWDDYTAGEMDVLTDYPPQDGRINGAQWHEVSYLGSRWQRTDIRFNKDSLTNYINKVNNLHGVVTIEAALFRNGSMAPNQYEFLKQVGAGIKSRK